MWSQPLAGIGNALRLFEGGSIPSLQLKRINWQLNGLGRDAMLVCLAGILCISFVPSSLIDIEIASSSYPSVQ